MRLMRSSVKEPCGLAGRCLGQCRLHPASDPLMGSAALPFRRSRRAVGPVDTPPPGPITRSSKRGRRFSGRQSLRVERSGPALWRAMTAGASESARRKQEPTEAVVPRPVGGYMRYRTKTGPSIPATATPVAPGRWPGKAPLCPRWSESVRGSGRWFRPRSPRRGSGTRWR